MASERRIGSEDSETRSALLDAAQKLMLEEGYPGVTSRRVAATAGLKPQLVHYYFRTMDELYIALLRWGASLNLERPARASASEQMLRAPWDDRKSDVYAQSVSVRCDIVGRHRNQKNKK